MVDERYQNLVGLLWSMHRKLNYLLTMKRDYGSGQPLASAEIHTMEAIGKNPDINLTDLAKLMVVTKGAMSQTIRRLEDKGLVRRERREGNDKEVLPSLTAQGWVAFAGHERYHLAMDKQIIDELSKMSDEQYVFLESVFRKLDQGADAYIDLLEQTG